VNLADVADQVAAAAATTGLRPHPRATGAIHPPALVVGIPESIEFDATYGRGCDVVTVTLFVLLGRASERAGAEALLGYMSGSGEASVKAAVEAGTYTACDDVHVATAAAGVITADGVDSLGATFTATITGRGA
jgi:hypothetical protein